MTSPAPSVPPAEPPRRGSRTRLFTALLALALLGLAGWYGWRWYVWQRELDRAILQLRNRDFSAALDHLAWCRWAWPRDPEGWFLSARTARRARQFDLAEEWLDRASDLGARAHAVHLERALWSAQNGRFPQMEEGLQAALRTTQTDYAFVAEVLTDEYMRQYRFPEARAVLNRWVELEPRESEAYLRRAWVAEHQLDFDVAIADYRKAYELDPARLPVATRVAELLLKIRRPAEALEEMERLPPSAHRDLNTALVLARCQRELGKFAPARATLDALGPDERRSGRAALERGKIALDQGQPSDAEKWLRQAQREMPRDRDLLYTLQQCLARQNRKEEADACARLLAEVDADGRKMNQLMEKLSRNSGDPALRFEVARVFLRNGVTEDAVRWLNLTLEIKPDHREAHQLLSEHYEKTGQPERARAHREAVARLRESPR